MLYDMELTKQLIGREPQLQLDLINSWFVRYSKLKDIDQRLISPNTTEDKKYPFDRKKVFAHGKSASYLKKVREKIGEKLFDGAVNEYLKKCGNCTGGYDDFKKFFGKSVQLEITALEKEHLVR